MLKLENQTLIINAHRSTLVLFESEITKLLQTDTALWSKALKRGKYVNRNEKMMNQKTTPANRRVLRNDEET